MSSRMLKRLCLQKKKEPGQLKRKKEAARKARKRRKRKVKRRAKERKAKTMMMVSHKRSTLVHLRLFKDSMNNMKISTRTGIREMRVTTTNKSMMLH